VFMNELRDRPAPVVDENATRSERANAHLRVAINFARRSPTGKFPHGILMLETRAERSRSCAAATAEATKAPRYRSAAASSSRHGRICCRRSETAEESAIMEAFDSAISQSDPWVSPSTDPVHIEADHGSLVTSAPDALNPLNRPSRQMRGQVGQLGGRRIYSAHAPGSTPWCGSSSTSCR